MVVESLWLCDCLPCMTIKVGKAFTILNQKIKVQHSVMNAAICLFKHEKIKNWKADSHLTRQMGKLLNLCFVIIEKGLWKWKITTCLLSCLYDIVYVRNFQLLLNLIIIYFVNYIHFFVVIRFIIFHVSWFSWILIDINHKKYELFFNANKCEFLTSRTWLKKLFYVIYLRVWVDMVHHKSTIRCNFY